MEQNSKGSLLVELLIAFGLASILLPALLTGLVSATKGGESYGERTQAMGLLREGEDAVRSVRATGWNNIATNGTYYPKSNGTAWTLSTNSSDGIVGNFTRSVAISDFTRSGKIDPSTKKIDVNVSWSSTTNRTASSTFYLSRYLGNTTFVQTTKAQFDLGTNNGTTVTNNSGGEVALGAGGKADWCAPSISAISPIDLPKSGVANAITAIQGTVFAGTGDNASGVSFANVAISDTDPPVGNITATYDGYKTNGVFGDGSYAYLATDNNTKEIEMINLNSIVAGKYQEAASFNAPGNGNGNSVFVTSTYGYMTGSVGNKLYNFNKPGQNLSLDADGVTLDNAGNKVYVVGNYAYVATNGTTNQLDIVDVSNPTNLTKVKGFSVNGLGATDIYVSSNGNRVYLVTQSSATQNEFFIIDTTTKTNPILLGSYDTAGMSPKGVTVVPGNKAIVVGTGGTQQYQVIDITTETAPVHCTSGGRSGGLAVATGVNGIASVLEADGDAYSYIITGDASSELKIIEGGPGGKYSSSGTYESSTIDMGSEVAFNFFTPTAVLPAGVTSSVTYKFAGAHAVNGSCNGVTFTYVDPVNFQIPYDSDGVGFENPARCFRYKIILNTSDSAYSPSLNDITVNYSP